MTIEDLYTGRGDIFQEAIWGFSESETGAHPEEASSCLAAENTGRSTRVGQPVSSPGHPARLRARCHFTRAFGVSF